MLVRFQVDACLATSKKSAPKGDLDDLGLDLSKLSISGSSNAASSTSSGTALKIISAGTLVPQSSLVEIKTRSEMSVQNFDWADTYPQLYLSKTPHLYLAVHTRGTFSSMQKKELETIDMSGAAQDAKIAVGSLVKVLKEIRRVSTEINDKKNRFTLVCMNGEMKVYPGGGDLLPLPLLAVFRP